MSRKETDFYSQCTLVQNRDGNRTCTVSYIPTKFAIVGKTISMKDQDKWSDWLVESAGPPRAAAYVEEHERDYLHHREATDI